MIVLVEVERVEVEREEGGLCTTGGEYKEDVGCTYTRSSDLISSIPQLLDT